MMYSYSKARQNLASLLEQALKEGKVRIKRKDGTIFVIKPESKIKCSPLDIESMNLHITTSEIIQFIHDSRKKN